MAESVAALQRSVKVAEGQLRSQLLYIHVCNFVSAQLKLPSMYSAVCQKEHSDERARPNACELLLCLGEDSDLKDIH